MCVYVLRAVTTIEVVAHFGWNVSKNYYGGPDDRNHDPRSTQKPVYSTFSLAVSGPVYDVPPHARGVQQILRTFLSSYDETRATIEVHRTFSQHYPSIRELKTCFNPTIDLEKNKTATYRMKHPMAYVGVQRESGEGECRISDDFGLRSPVAQKPFQPKKTVYLYRSTRHVDLNISPETRLRKTFVRATPEQLFFSCASPKNKHTREICHATR